jgi:hypothetical protein
MPGDFERSLWGEASSSPRKLEDMDALRREYPDETIEILEEEPFSPGKVTRILGFKHKQSSIRVGYQCGNCEAIVLGAPRIKDDLSIEELEACLSGREGFDVHCTECYARLYEQTTRIS